MKVTDRTHTLPLAPLGIPAWGVLRPAADRAQAVVLGFDGTVAEKLL